MSVFDIIIAAILVVSTIAGGYRGVMREAIGLGAWFIGIWCAFRYAEPAGVMLQGMNFTPALNDPLTRQVAGFVGVLVLAFLGVTLIGRLIRDILCAIGLTPLDRVAGLGFGFLRGVLIVVALVTLASMTPMADGPAWQDSRLIPFAKLAAQLIIQRLPTDVARYFPT